MQRKTNTEIYETVMFGKVGDHKTQTIVKSPTSVMQRTITRSLNRAATGSLAHDSGSMFHYSH